MWLISFHLHDSETRFFPNIILIIIIVYMKKILDADWLKTLQCKKCNTKQKVQITMKISEVSLKKPGEP